MSLQNKSSYDNIKDKMDLYPVLKSLEQKINLLYEIYTESSAALDFDTDLNHDKFIFEQLQNIKETSKELLKTLLNTNTDEKMFALIHTMQKMQKIDVKYLPEKKPIEIFDIENLDPALNKGEYGIMRIALLNFLLKQRKIMRVNEYDRKVDKTGIIMLGPEERQQYRIFIKNGLFCKLNQKAKFGENNDFVRYSTLTMQSHNKKFYAAYVINTKGEIYLFEHKEGALRHSSMMAGNSVFAAGEMVIVEGKLTKISTYSGHYEPDMRNVYMVLKYLERQGVSLRLVKINDIIDRFKYHDDVNTKDFFVHSESGIRGKLLANMSLAVAPKTNITFVELLASDVIAWGDSLQLAKCPSIYSIVFMLNHRIQREIDCLIQDLIEVRDDICTPIITTDSKQNYPLGCTLLAKQALSIDDIIKYLQKFEKHIKEQIAKLLKQDQLYSHDVNLIRREIKAYLDGWHHEVEDKYPNTDGDKEKILKKITETKEKLRF